MQADEPEDGAQACPQGNGLRGSSEPLKTYRKMAIRVSQADPPLRSTSVHTVLTEATKESRA